MSLLARYDLPRAGRALKSLLENPDDLPQVFRLVDALAGKAPERLRERFKATEEGRRMLADQPDIVPVLTDREALRRLPEGSLAHAYLAFVESENISAQGLLDAAAEGEKESRGEAEDPTRWPRTRMRDTHDLWHAVTGYRGDVLGELALLGFMLGQGWHPGVALVISGGFMKGLSGTDAWLVAEGYARGKRAVPLAAQPWEQLLALPLNEVRARLRISAPPLYTPLRSSELRARGVVSPLRKAA